MTGLWISADPAIASYLPVAPTNKQARQRNANLPSRGGVFNPINLTFYTFGGDNAVKYVDPNGGLLTLYVDKNTQKMTVTYDDRGFHLEYQMDITTAVVPRDPSQNTSMSKWQDTGGTKTHPTQFPNGTYTNFITSAGNTGDATYGDKWLKTIVSQMLKGKNGKMVRD